MTGRSDTLGSPQKMGGSMRARTGYVAILVLLLWAPSANAALSKGQWLLGASGGLLIPVADFKDVGATGFGLSADADYVLGPSGSIGANVAYNRNGFSNDLKTAIQLATGLPIDGHYTVMHYGAHGRFFLAPESKTKPFIAVGGGLYNFKATATLYGASSSNSETKGGINGGLGLLFDAGRSAHAGIQGTFHNIIVDGPDVQYINAAAVLLFDVGRK